MLAEVERIRLNGHNLWPVIRQPPWEALFHAGFQPLIGGQPTSRNHFNNLHVKMPIFLIKSVIGEPNLK
jgi:hypothetical protein